MAGVTGKAMKEHGRNVARAMYQSKGKSPKKSEKDKK